MNKTTEFINTTEEKEYRIEKIKNLFTNMYHALDKNCNRGKEKSLAYNKLVESQFWAVESILKEGDK